MARLTPSSGNRLKGLSAPVPLTAQHDTADFDCGHEVLDHWLKQRALGNEGRFARTYVACVEARVAGFFCILVGSVERRLAPGKLRRNAPEPTPVAILGRLAVDRRFAGRGLGADLLADAFRRIAAASGQIRISALLVHAKDEKAKAFYMACAEFIEYPADSRTLFLPIESLIAAIG